MRMWVCRILQWFVTLIWYQWSGCVGGRRKVMPLSRATICFYQQVNLKCFIRLCCARDSTLQETEQAVLSNAYISAVLSRSAKLHNVCKRVIDMSAFWEGFFCLAYQNVHKCIHQYLIKGVAWGSSGMKCIDKHTVYLRSRSIFERRGLYFVEPSCNSLGRFAEILHATVFFSKEET